MVWLALSCIMSFGFGQLFKWSQRRGDHGPTVVAANYITLALAQGLYLVSRGQLELSPPVLELGALTGGFFIVAMIVMTQALTSADVGAVLTAFRLSILLPILLGVWLWHEPVQPLQVTGVVMALFGMVLMTASQRRSSPNGSSKLGVTFSIHALSLLVLVFVSQSLSHIGISSVHHLGLDPQRLSVIFTIAATAGLLGAGVVIYKRHRPTRSELAMGAFIGVFNMLNLVVILITLSILPRTIYFPVTGCSVVILDNLFAHFFWKERLRPAGIAGAALGAAAMLLVFP